MKPIIKNEDQDVILTSEITVNHIVVGIIQARPTILYCSDYEEINTLSFLCLDKETIIGNSFYNDGHTASIKDVIDFRIKQGQRIEVFHEKDWKKALEWLIKNAE